MELGMFIVGLFGFASTILWLRKAAGEERVERQARHERRWRDWYLDEEFRELETAEMLAELKADMAESKRERRAT